MGQSSSVPGCNCVEAGDAKRKIDRNHGKQRLNLSIGQFYLATICLPAGARGGEDFALFLEKVLNFGSRWHGRLGSVPGDGNRGHRRSPCDRTERVFVLEQSNREGTVEGVS